MYVYVVVWFTVGPPLKFRELLLEHSGLCEHFLGPNPAF